MNNDVIKVQLSCGVDYYKGEKGDKPVKGVDYFTEQDINEIIERIEAGEIDLTSYATKEYVANAIEGMVVEETDPTVPEWAKAETKPSYTANEVGALPADTALFSGDYEDLSNKPELFSGDYDDLSNKPNLFSGNYNDLTNKPTIPTVPVNVSAFYNDAGYLNAHQDLTGYATESYVDEAIANIELPDGGITVETDPTVPSWAKQANKPTYTAQEVGALPANTALFSGDYNDLSNKPTIPTVPTNISAFTNDAGYLTSIEYTSYDFPGMGNPYGLLMNNWEDVVAITTSISDFGCMSMAIDEDDNPTHMGALNGDMLLLQNFVSGNGIGLFPDGIIASNMADYEQNENYVGITFGANYDGLYVNGSKVALVSDIPTAYTLPTATTSTLGGVKVDGTTITISNGVISATPSGSSYTLPTASTSTLGGVKVDGSTITIDANGVISSSASGGGSYTAGQGISIDNGEISFDGVFDDTIGINYTTYYASDDIENETCLAIDGLTVHSYGESDIETGDQEDTGIDITSSGITFTSPEGGTHTLGNALNGELSIDGDKILTTADNISGGSSYTAGDGIDIDSNGVISRTDIGLTGMSLFASGFISNFSFGNTPSASTVSQLAENLKKYGISSYSGSSFTPTALNEAMGGTRYATRFLSGDVVPALSWLYQAYNSTSNVGSWGYRDTPCFVIGDNTCIFGTTSFSKLRTLVGWNFGELISLNTSSLSNLTSTAGSIRRLPNLMSDINNVIGDINTAISSKQDAIIPSAPSTNGNYLLQATVVDGEVSYDWVSVQTGGSY